MIKEPMDLSKIENNLRTGQYATPTQFHADINKIVRNSEIFNQGNLEFTQITKDFENYYFKIIAEPNQDQRSVTNYSEPSKVPKPASQASSSVQIKKKKLERPLYSDNISLGEKK
jgi:hypothetical protein